MGRVKLHVVTKTDKRALRDGEGEIYPVYPVYLGVRGEKNITTLGYAK